MEYNKTMEIESAEIRTEQETLERKELVITKETANLLAAVGNHEAKAIVLAAMQEGIIYDVRELHSRIMGLQGSGTGWKLSRRLPFKYCQSSLSPIGLVTREVINSDLSTYGYMITGYGERVGKALVGHLLRWSWDHPGLSLYQMLGSTGSPSGRVVETEEDSGDYRKRAPETRVKIFWELATNPSPSLRLTDLLKGISEESEFLLLQATSPIEDHLENLSDHGVIGYESSRQGNPFSFYRVKETLPEGEPITIGHNKSLTQETYDILKETPQTYFSLPDLAEILRQRYPDKYKGKGMKTLTNRLSGILAGLAGQGFVEYGKFRWNIKSDITVSPEQREVIISLLEIIDRFQTKDEGFLQAGRRLTDQILSDPGKVAALLHKARENSPNVQSLPLSETASLILGIVQRHPNTTGRQIQQKLKEEYGKGLVGKTVGALLNHLRQQGQIKAELTKRGMIYSLPEYISTSKMSQE